MRKRQLGAVERAASTLTIKRHAFGVESLCNSGDFDSVSDQEVRAVMLYDGVDDFKR